jgi:CO/xanthine dehydrogenase FAD-binding subunit
MIKKLNVLTDIVIKYINAMPNRKVSYSNINFLFRRDRTLQIVAIACIDILEDKGIDSRDLSIAFSNSFSDHERCLDIESILEGGKYIIDAPRILIERAMLWLTEQVIIDSSYRAKLKKGVPPRALQSNSAFTEFLYEIRRNEGGKQKW